ncbi:glycoside hydrolase family 88 protein [Desertivirga xinjiangensis]|uniref:glycoside hydrolase family 88 protein n=1 Tax=Desertivirga xinjiangensis TaxID=539206 RepID=UPI00210D2056|nr:glycoside hydrolase family 88 protein [Pedobacter xinjiangensis]
MKQKILAIIFPLCLVGALSLMPLFACTPVDKTLLTENFDIARIQYRYLLNEGSRTDTLFPRTLDDSGKLKLTDKYEWTSGFFPGCLWYMYDGLKDDSIKNEAIKWTEKLESLKDFTEHHDLGFMMYCSYGNAYRVTGNPNYKNILVEAAKSLSSRFDPKVGSIKSWNRFGSWDGKNRYDFPVIIDNMMNLELLFFASKVTGDPYFKNIAVKHAENVMKNQIREDYSCHHVVCYDPQTGAVLSKETSQGYANNSTWARGQSWGIYGFTMSYRETGDKRFLNTAKKMADFYIDNENLPSDFVAYWDFNANEKGYTPSVKSKAKQTPTKYRDVSAAAVTASALLELSTFKGVDGTKYREAAEKIIASLSSPAYRAKTGTNGGFLLKHSVGSIAHGVEIDVPLVYADYYFLEALNRYSAITNRTN